MSEIALPDLSPAQRACVFDTSQKVLCVAGPGSGKTRTLIAAIAHRLDEGAIPSDILAITFTRLAAAEMRERLSDLCGRVADSMTICTVHALCYELVCRGAKLLGFPNENVALYDDKDRDLMLEDVTRGLRDRISIAALRRAIDHEASTGLAPTDRVLQTAMATYLARLARHPAVDYATAIILARRLIDMGVARIWAHVFVDEAQDLDPTQVAVIRAISPERLFMVGDIDQTIYGWRGASPATIVDLPKALGMSIHRLEVNHRSSQAVVQAAGSLIKHNATRLEKENLAAPGADPGAVFVRDERCLPDELDTLTLFPECTIAVLARTHADLARVSQLLAAHTPPIPHDVVGRRDKLLERDDVKEVLALMAFPEWPNSPMICDRALRADNVGQIDRQRIVTQAAREGETLYEASLSIMRGLRDFYDEITTFSIMERLAVSNARLVASGRGLQPEEYRLLAGIVSAYTRQESVKKQTTGRLAAWLSMRDGADQTFVRSQVSLMTIHAAKGLEFDHVFLAGASALVFPSIRAKTPEQQEEERRLAFVAITRARKTFTFLPDTPPVTPFASEAGVPCT